MFFQVHCSDALPSLEPTCNRPTTCKTEYFFNQLRFVYSVYSWLKIIFSSALLITSSFSSAVSFGREVAVESFISACYIFDDWTLPSSTFPVSADRSRYFSLSSYQGLQGNNYSIKLDNWI